MDDNKPAIELISKPEATDEIAASDAATKRPHLSASSLDMFARCPESWRRRYIERERIPPGLAAHKGKAVHRGAELNMRQKIETRVDLKPSDVVDFTVQTFKDMVASEEYVITKSDDPVDKTVDQVAALSTLHITQQAPDYQPAMVEQWFRVNLPTLTHDLVGVVDVVDEAGDIVDFKTAKRSYSGHEADESVQLSLYAASLADLNQTNVTVKLDVAIQPTKTKPARRQLVQSTRDSTDLPIIARRLSVVSRSIDAGLFPPAPVGSWWCSESWCGYWHTCPYINAERIATSKQVEAALNALAGE